MFEPHDPDLRVAYQRLTRRQLKAAASALGLGVTLVVVIVFVPVPRWAEYVVFGPLVGFGIVCGWLEVRKLEIFRRDVRLRRRGRHRSGA